MVLNPLLPVSMFTGTRGGTMYPGEFKRGDLLHGVALNDVKDDKNDLEIAQLWSQPRI